MKSKKWAVAAAVVATAGTVFSASAAPRQGQSSDVTIVQWQHQSDARVALTRQFIETPVSAW